MPQPQYVSLVEVGPRDGLQNEARTIDVGTKAALVDGLASAGLRRIETGSFVNPRWVPQMADSEAVFAAITRAPDTRYAALTPNVQGLERALAAGADEVAIFAAASEAFSQKNINCSIAASLKRFEGVMQLANTHALPVRGYVSCVLGCPLEGPVAPQRVAGVTRELLALGCYEVSLGDTIGTGTPGSMQRLLGALLPEFDPAQLAVHCHDTYGQAMGNILIALQHGIATVDASVAGLGGCPYAAGATGNVATEDVVYMLQGMEIDCGVDLEALVAVGNRISAALERPNGSRVAKALNAKA